MAIELRKSLVVASVVGWLVSGGAARAAEAPAVDKALGLPPVQAGVQIDIPEGDEIAKCTIKAEKDGSTSGWVVRDSQGQILRRFLDTNGDNYVDQWCYYRYGVEVYRDIDSNFNRKADKYRWLNTAGSRIGIDTNEDRKIDAWQNISAEEVTAELVAALRDRDRARFELLLVTPTDLSSMGLGKEKAEQLAKKVETARASFATLLNEQQAVTPATKWVSFAGSQPGVVPAGTDESTSDVLAYENVAAMIETDGQPGAIAVGTLVRVAGGWRLIDAPQIGGGEGVAEIEPRNFFFAAGARAERPEQIAGRPSEKVQKLMEELQNLGDLNSQSTPAQHERRVELMEALAAESDEETRPQWYRQLADMLSAAVQTGTYPDGIKRLESLHEKLKADPANEELAFYVQYRWMTAKRGQDLSGPSPDYAKIQTQWIEDLEKFVEEAKKYPDSADAMLELAISQEFAGNEDKALKWYETIVHDFPEAPVRDKAAGAKTRLTSVGQAIPLSGKLIGGGPFDLARLKGKVVVVQYWATWCEPCKADMPLLKELRAKFKDKFEVVGVCLDNDQGEMMAFLRENDPRWPQLYEEGGMESRFATEMGIQTLPTMILIDKEGKVVDRNIRAQGLASEVMKLLN